MTPLIDPVLDLPTGRAPDPEEFIAAAMRWHFSPETGSPYWLERARTLDFDPRRDVRTFADLRLFPNVVNELRNVPVRDLVPRGYGTSPHIVGVYESGGTTGAPKRVPLLADWADRFVTWCTGYMDERGHPRGAHWLAVIPTGPHIWGEMVARQARHRGGFVSYVDLDPRWVKKCLAEGRTEEAEGYAAHVIAQAEFVLDNQDIGVLVTTPPLLERLARSERLVELVNDKVRAIIWGGAHMDPDTRDLLRTEVFPGVQLFGQYGSTMILGGMVEREGIDDACVFDPFTPYVTFSVIDPESGKEVAHGERGQVVMNFVSKSGLLPNNLERDLATRIAPLRGQVGDSVADVSPVPSFDDEAVIEGVY
ncbi:phenazine antibiotic biosynthesis protein [Streptomyces ossamyceticus]|uniref:Phenazine antibiotic biosynthesis protein n=1 Tax=Streptomyces ossamyceticus TaxID=249581 RepID=A0ABV2UTH9_9ACTN